MKKTRAMHPLVVVALATVLALPACGREARSEAAPDDQAVPAEPVTPGPIGRAADVAAQVEARTSPDELLDEIETPAEPAPAPASRPKVTRRPDPAPSAPPASQPPMVATDPPGSGQTMDAPEAALPQPSIAAGTEVRLRIEVELNTMDVSTGDTVYAVVAEDILASDGMVLVPEGTRVRGEVREAHKSENSEDEAVLALSFQEFLFENGDVLPMRSTVLEAPVETEAKDTDARSAGKVAAGAAAGALLGRILGGDNKDAVKGAVVGAAAGGAVAYGTRDGHAKLPAGSIVVIRVEDQVRLVT